jgi:hypothetical protein
MVAEIFAGLIDPIERLVARYTDAASLAALLAREIPPVIDCRRKAVPAGEKMQRDLLADVYDNLSALLGNRNPNGTFKRADRCGGGKAGRALGEVLDAKHDPDLVAYRGAWLLAAAKAQGLSEADALAEVREIETSVCCR